MVGTLLGIALNLRMPGWDLSEGMFSLIVLVSMGLIALGFVPGIRKWRCGRLATRVSVIAIWCYIGYVLWAVGSYKET